ncbi:MAG: endonuclease/exonuclease/phosphatase family protein [Wenyingzhuangia sp.]|jgi:vancomycin resistance protein VanJ|uniref:endonuclease/exonuclease/phosphatase family protein n=1 Tax=Wenyingzhuangia sp. TaxID=1964193 RepID=UPI00321B93D0
MGKLNFWNKVLFFFNFVIVVLLLFTYSLPYIDPENWSSISVLSLAYPILLFINIAFIILWIVKLKLHFIVSLGCILIGISHLHDFYAIEKKEIIKQSDIKVLSYNVRHFNALKAIDSKTVKEDICSFINNKNPDIICFQEYKNTPNLKIDLPKVYEYKNSNLAIYSKYPVVKQGNSLFKKGGNNIVYIDLKILDETIRIYNVHLQSFKLDINKENYGGKDSEALLNKFMNVFNKQSKQIKALKNHIKECPHKSIVVGDFNNTAFSWNYHEIMEDRKDAFTEAGSGFGKSYDYFFPFRIDFILPDNTMEVGKFTTYYVNLSDHFPIMARISLNRQTKL